MTQVIRIKIVMRVTIKKPATLTVTIVRIVKMKIIVTITTGSPFVMTNQLQPFKLIVAGIIKMMPLAKQPELPLFLYTRTSAAIQEGTNKAIESKKN